VSDTPLVGTWRLLSFEMREEQDDYPREPDVETSAPPKPRGTSTSAASDTGASRESQPTGRSDCLALRPTSSRPTALLSPQLRHKVCRSPPAARVPQTTVSHRPVTETHFRGIVFRTQERQPGLLSSCGSACDQQEMCPDAEHLWHIGAAASDTKYGVSRRGNILSFLQVRHVSPGALD
jgi:hypothetical protein